MSFLQYFARQEIQHLGEALNLTPFGRARIDRKKFDAPGVDAADRYVMLYWVKLPVFGYFYDELKDADVWGKRVLFWHGERGFKVRWCPTGGER